MRQFQECAEDKRENFAFGGGFCMGGSNHDDGLGCSRWGVEVVGKSGHCKACIAKAPAERHAYRIPWMQKTKLHRSGMKAQSHGKQISFLWLGFAQFVSSKHGDLNELRVIGLAVLKMPSFKAHP